MKNNRNYYKSFALFWGVRMAYWLLTKPKFEMMHDPIRYIKLGHQIVEGNFDMDVGSFLTAPFYPWLLAVFTYLFGQWSLVCLSFFQITLESLAGVFLLKMASELYGNDKRLFKVITLLYAFNPTTFYYCYAIGQESIFQSTFIITLYFFIKTLSNDNSKDLIGFSIAFSISFLTKSHILLAAPFFIFNWFWQTKAYKAAAYKTFVFLTITILTTLPNGLYNLRKHNVYTLSSDGLAMYLYYGNSACAYQWVVKDDANYFNFPVRTNPDKAYQLLAEFVYFEEEGSQERLKKLPPYSERHRIYIDSTLSWIKQNPKKWLEIKAHSLAYFIQPGIVKKIHVPFGKWIAALLSSSLLYGFGYYGLYLCYKEDKRKHFWIIGIILSLFIFAMVFGLLNRFRVITFDPFILFYAGFGLCRRQVIKYKR